MAAGNIDAVIAQAKLDRKRLDSAAIGPFSLTAIGIASVVGAGIFVTIGEASARYAGPSVIFSFMLAGLAAGVTALCYAELAAMVPAAGSTYSYAYAVFGSFLAWFIGWDLLLEYLFAASTVAVGWSGYFVSFLGSIGISVPHDLVTPPFGDDAGILNLPALAIVFATCTLLFVGTRESTRANNVMVALKLGVLLLFIGVGAFYITKANWEPFVPENTGGFGDYGITGILRAAGVVFFAYVGFDAVSTAAAEARRPQRTIPIGLLATVIISTVLYVLIGIVMTGMVPFKTLNVADPLALAVREGRKRARLARERGFAGGCDRSGRHGARNLLRSDEDLHADVVRRDAPRSAGCGRRPIQDPGRGDPRLRGRGRRGGGVAADRHPR